MILRSRSSVAAQQRQFQLRPPPQPQARPIAGIAGDALERFQDAQHRRRADGVAPGERAPGIAEAEPDGGVDVIRRGDALLGDLAGDIDDHGQHPLGHRAGAVGDQADRHPVGTEQGERRAPRRGLRRRRRQQRTVGIEPEKRIDAEIQYHFTDQWQLSAAVTNLKARPLVSYQGYPQFVEDASYPGRKYNFAIRYDF